MVEEMKIDLDNFPSYTTVHGLKFMVRGNHSVRRILWTCMILLTLAALLRQFYVSIEKLAQKDTIIITTVQQSDLIKFPAVSICNMNMMKKSQIIGTDSQVFLDKLDIYFPRQDGNLSRFSSSSFNAEEAVTRNGHKLKDMILECLWGSENCTEKNFTMFYSFARGLCYTFNSGKPGYPIQYAHGPGQTNGLSLILNAEVDEYYGMFGYEGAGFKVLVHDQNDEPDIGMQGFEVSAGFKLSYPMKKEKFIGLPLPTCHGQTSQSSEVYSQSACIINCKMVKIKKACNCRMYSNPDTEEFSGLRFCNLTNNQVLKCVLKFSLTVRNSECECPLPCTIESYRGNTFISKYPSPQFWTTYEENKKKNVSKTMAKFHGLKENSVSTLQIFYSSPEEKIMKQNLVYNYDDLISDFGGFLGLFLGCSLLSLCEFLDLFITWCQRRLLKNRVTVIG